MNMTIYLDSGLGKQLTLLAKSLGRKRNAVIREAIKNWVEKHQTKEWPESVRDWKGIDGEIRFEDFRPDLLLPRNVYLGDE